MVGMDLELARFMKCMESTMKIQCFADTGSVIDLEEGFSSDMDIDATAASSSLSPTPTYNQLSQIASRLTLICITPNRWMSTTSFLSLLALVEPKINICAALKIMVNLSQWRAYNIVSASNCNSRCSTSGSSSLNDKFWKRIWMHSLPSKIKFFWLRILKNNLRLTEVLYKRPSGLGVVGYDDNQNQEAWAAAEKLLPSPIAAEAFAIRWALTESRQRQ